MLPIHDADQESSVGNELSSIGASIALISMPWGAISRASIALGILKQCAAQMGVAADVHYLNIRFAERVGINLYRTISENSALIPEWFFSAYLFGSHGLKLIENSIDDLSSPKMGELGAKMMQGLNELGCSEAMSRKITEEIIPQYIDDCLTTIDWSKYRVVGFSTTFAQTTSSLLLAKLIKERHPEAKIVFGGANMDSEMGFEILQAFDWIDYVVHGEAERSFPKLLSNILTDRGFEKVPGVSMRCGRQAIAGFTDSQPLADLNESPVPDYSDYFKEVERWGVNKWVRITLLFESSRGCWWGAKAHCTFCGLNGSTMAFRKKSHTRVHDEILQMADNYRCLSLSAVDNIMDTEYFQTLLPRLAEADLDLSLFYEVKASLTKEQVRRLSAAGITKIQPGIESLNTEVLRIMRKGVTAGQNVQLLKWCSEFGIDPSWNLLYGFPGERADQYLECPRIFRLLFHLRPPEVVTPVKFERFSPYHFDRNRFNLTLWPMALYGMIYPSALIDFDKVAYYFDGIWEGQTEDPESYIRPTRDAHKEWVNLSQHNKVFFYYEKGPDFLTLYDNRPLRPGDDLTIRKRHLNSLQKKIYLYCDGLRSITSIQEMLNQNFKRPINKEITNTILDQFVDHGLMFREGDRYLSLAVRKNGKRSGRISNENT